MSFRLVKALRLIALHEETTTSSVRIGSSTDRIGEHYIELLMSFEILAEPEIFIVTCLRQRHRQKDEIYETNNNLRQKPHKGSRHRRSPFGSLVRERDCRWVHGWRPSRVCAQSVNIAPSGAATQSSEFRAGSPFGASNAVDGDLTNFTHTAATQANPRWELEFDSENTIEQVVLHNRAGFESRLRDVVVTVRDSSGRVTYNSGILNPENTLNSPARIVVDLPTPVLGQSVRVDRIADPDLSGSGGVGGRSEPNVLSLAEVVVQGCTVAPSTGAIDWSAPQNTCLLYTSDAADE